MLDNFRVHMLNPDGVGAAQCIAQAYDELVSKIAGLGVDFKTREGSIILTKLEEACFFSKKSMASNPKNQQQTKEQP